jgi:hypothetical protein
MLRSSSIHFIHLPIHTLWSVVWHVFNVPSSNVVIVMLGILAPIVETDDWVIAKAG